MFRFRILGFVVVLASLCVSCGGGGGGGAAGNANPGIYEGAYSRGGGSVVIDIASQGPINVILTDQSGGTYTGTVTENRTQGSFDFTGTLHNTQSPTKTLSLTASLIPGGSQVTINGQVTGDFSVSFGAIKVSDTLSTTLANIAAQYDGTDTLSQSNQQTDSGNVHFFITGTGTIGGHFTSAAHPTLTGSFFGKVGDGGGVVGFGVIPGQSATFPFFGTVEQQTTQTVIDIFYPQTPNPNIEGKFTATKSADNPFTGSFKGSAYNGGNGGSISSITLTFNPDGSFGGISTPTIGGTPSTFSGNVTKSGAVTGTIGSNTLTGALDYDSSQDIIGSTTQGNQSAPSSFLFVPNGGPFQFTGSWQGSYTESSGPGGTITATILPNGTVSGTRTPTGGSATPFTGTLNVTGVLTGGGALGGGAAFPDPSPVGVNDLQIWLQEFGPTDTAKTSLTRSP